MRGNGFCLGTARGLRKPGEHGRRGAGGAGLTGVDVTITGCDQKEPVPGSTTVFVFQLGDALIGDDDQLFLLHQRCQDLRFVV